MNIHNTYTKTLTALNEKTIEYKIISEKFENKTCYGIQVSEKSEKFSNSESIKNISDSFELVKKIALCLFENSIDTSHFKDIVEDYITAMSR